MPITDNGFEYAMPDYIRRLIDRDFCWKLQNELYKIFNLSLCDFADESVVYDGGTAGWNVALGLACIETNKQEIYKYYKALPWYDSDMFDSDLQELMVSNNVILNNTIDDLIEEKLKISQSEFCECIHCGKRFLFSQLNIDEELSEGDVQYYICNKCKDDIENKNNTNYTPNANNYYKNGLTIIAKQFK